MRGDGAAYGGVLYGALVLKLVRHLEEGGCDGCFGRALGVQECCFVRQYSPGAPRQSGRESVASQDKQLEMVQVRGADFIQKLSPKSGGKLAMVMCSLEMIWWMAWQVDGYRERGGSGRQGNTGKRFVLVAFYVIGRCGSLV